MTTTITADTLNDDQIETLRAEAGSHGDYATVAACMVALGWSTGDMAEHIVESDDPAVRHWIDGGGAGDRAHARQCVADVLEESRQLAQEA